MGLQGNDWKQNKHSLFEAISRSEVKFYIPSECRASHEITNDGDNKTSEPKAHEFEAAKEKRPKVVGIFISLIREQTFSTGLNSVRRKGTEYHRRWRRFGESHARENGGGLAIEATILAYREAEYVL